MPHHREVNPLWGQSVMIDDYFQFLLAWLLTYCDLQDSTIFFSCSLLKWGDMKFVKDVHGYVMHSVLNSLCLLKLVSVIINVCYALMKLSVHRSIYLYLCMLITFSEPEPKAQVSCCDDSSYIVLIIFTFFFTFPIKLLKGFQWNLTGTSTQCPLLKFVNFILFPWL